MDYIQMINDDLTHLSEADQLKAWLYVNALRTLQRQEAEIEDRERELGIRREVVANPDIMDADVKRCTFCGKPTSKVRLMIAGPAAMICNECLDIAVNVLKDESIHMPLKNVLVNQRAITALEKAGYTEVEDLMELTEDQLRDLPGIGPATADAIVRTLKTVGIYLK